MQRGCVIVGAMTQPLSFCPLVASRLWKPLGMKCGRSGRKGLHSRVRTDAQSLKSNLQQPNPDFPELKITFKPRKVSSCPVIDKFRTVSHLFSPRRVVAICPDLNAKEAVSKY